jgi:hypothetical protein
MHKKDYELIAGILRDLKPSDPARLDTWERIVHSLAMALDREHYKFDRRRFIRSCTD